MVWIYGWVEYCIDNYICDHVLCYGVLCCIHCVGVVVYGYNVVYCGMVCYAVVLWLVVLYLVGIGFGSITVCCWVCVISSMDGVMLQWCGLWVCMVWYVCFDLVTMWWVLL